MADTNRMQIQADKNIDVNAKEKVYSKSRNCGNCGR